MRKLVTDNCETIDIENLEPYLDNSDYIVIAHNSENTNQIICLAKEQDGYCWISYNFNIIKSYTSYKKAIRDAICKGYTVEVVDRQIHIEIAHFII